MGLTVDKQYFSAHPLFWVGISHFTENRIAGFRVESKSSIVDRIEANTTKEDWTTDFRKCCALSQFVEVDFRFLSEILGQHRPRPKLLSASDSTMTRSPLVDVQLQNCNSSTTTSASASVSATSSRHIFRNSFRKTKNKCKAIILQSDTDEKAVDDPVDNEVLVKAIHPENMAKGRLNEFLTVRKSIGEWLTEKILRKSLYKW